MKKLLLSLLFSFVFVTHAFAFYLYWPPNNGSSSYKVYQVTSYDPITFVYLDEVTENRFNVESYISDTNWTFFAVSNCCGSECSLIFNTIGIMSTDVSDVIPESSDAYYLIEIKFINPMLP